MPNNPVKSSSRVKFRSLNTAVNVFSGDACGRRSVTGAGNFIRIMKNRPMSRARPAARKISPKTVSEFS